MIISELQPIRRHLKRPQLNLHLPIPQFQLRFIILQHICLPNLLHIENLPINLDGPSARTSKAVVDSQDDAPALAFRKLPSRDILVVFTSLDSVEHQGWRARQGDGLYDRGAVSQADPVRRWGVDFHGVVKVSRCTDGTLVQGTAVWKNGVADVVTTWYK